MMKTFIRKLSFFVILIFIGWAGLEIFYRAVPNNYTVKDKHIKASYNDIEVLLFGNSHSFYGLNPSFFEQYALNVSNISQTLMYDELLFNKHIDSLTALKYIVLPVEYSSLGQDDNMPELQWRKYFYETQMGLKTGMVSPFDIKRYSLALSPRFSLTVGSMQKFFNNGTIADCNDMGWAPLQGVNGELNNLQSAKATVQKHEKSQYKFDKNIYRLKSIIDTCKSRGIKVLLVTMPVTSYYADNINKEKFTLIMKECNTLDSKYDNVSYINLFQDSHFSNKDFYDADHLNSNGAKKCSLIVNEAINKI